MPIPKDNPPIGHSTKKSRLLYLNYQNIRGEEYGQVGFGGPLGLGGKVSEVMPWEKAERMFGFIEFLIDQSFEVTMESTDQSSVIADKN